MGKITRVGCNDDIAMLIWILALIWLLGKTITACNMKHRRMMNCVPVKTRSSPN